MLVAPPVNTSSRVHGDPCEEEIVQKNKFSGALTLALALVVSGSLTAGTRAAAQTEKLLHSFNGPGEAGGLYPNGSLIIDAAGNLYGTTPADGNSCTGSSCGTVFELEPATGGTYTEKVLHAFSRSGKDAWNPEAGLAMDASGNLYGTTIAGGAYGEGVAFKLTLTDGAWIETVLHSFGASSNDGVEPLGALILDATGNVYGTTYSGGAHNSGTVFEISPNGSGGWMEKVVLAFNGNDGAYPFAKLAMDSAGNIYGSTTVSNTSSGTAFELSPVAGGHWTFTTLYYFTVAPSAGFILDASGNLYSTTAYGGTNGEGAVIELSKSTGGTWTEQTLYSFCSLSDCGDGSAPNGVVFDSAGNLYGTAYNGGAYEYGTAFKLMPATGGTWSVTVLHSFGNGTDGANPEGVVLDASGNLDGATLYGGRHGYGSVFQIAP
jgi:uncharacterized repeat protein (TIGR03803 family)